MEGIRNPGTDPCLGNLEHQEHHRRENHQAPKGVGQHGIYFILSIFLPGQNLSGLHGSDDFVYKLKSLPVSRLHRLLAGQVHVALVVRCFLAFPTERCGSLNNLPKSIPGGCGGVQYRAAQLFRQ